MNIFGKNKTQSQVPPAPPKRPEKQQQVVHRNYDAEEEEDEYTYEIPPSEGQGKIQLVSANQLEASENLYLDRPAVRRFSEPNNLLQPKPQMFLSNSGADGGTNEETFNFKDLERALKKGMTKTSPALPPPLSARRVSLPVLPASGSQGNTAKSRESFLSLKDDKEEFQEESIYVECEPSTASLPCRTLPTPLAHPLKQPKPNVSPPGAQQDCGLQNKAWYAGSCDRHMAEAALLQFNKDSAYLVRRSSRHSWNQPFTLAVLYKSHVYNIPIRYVESCHQYTLGKDGKSHEELFDSVTSIIQNYTERPLVLIDGSTSAKEQTCLVFPVKP